MREDAGGGEICEQGFDGETAKAGCGGYGIDDLLVLLGFERAGGIDEAAAGGEAA